jgi:uncharacterized membrane protein YjgN (DUF898 family)
MSEQTAAAPSAGAETITFRQTGTAGGITPTVLLNAVLNILTLSLWRFWGRTKVRRYLWSTTEINGEGCEYTGTGWEMFRAFLVVMFAIFLPIYAALIAGQLLLPPKVFLIIFGIAYIPLIIFFVWLLGLAMWLARRYRLSRTRWRGVRFGMAGSPNGFSWALLGYAFLSAVTLGWYSPAADMRLFRRLWRETYFGDRAFTITHPDKGLAGPLYPTFALAWFGMLLGYVVYFGLLFAAFGTNPERLQDPSELPTFIAVIYLGAFAFVIIASVLAMPYYAAVLRRQASIVGLEGLSFKLDAKAGSLLWLFIGNFLIVIVTLGFGSPYAELRTARWVINRLSSEGAIDLEAIKQNADKGPKSGEGLADFFDIGGAF